jgi:FkbM family methyltransferase
VSVFALGQYSYVHDDVCVRVEEGDVVLDVGGCWGDTALRFASLVGPSGKVYTFEFDPESVEVLRTNLALNPELAARVEIVEKALWSRSGEVLTVHQAGRCTSVDTPTGEKAMTVETITLDDFVEGAGVERVGFIKMDVEGAEASVLAGASRTIRDSAPRLAIAAYHKDDDLIVLREAIEDAVSGYRFYIDTFSPTEDETVLFAVPSSTHSRESQ